MAGRSEIGRSRQCDRFVIGHLPMADRHVKLRGEFDNCRKGAGNAGTAGQNPRCAVAGGHIAEPAETIRVVVVAITDFPTMGVAMLRVHVMHFHGHLGLGRHGVLIQPGKGRPYADHYGGEQHDQMQGQSAHGISAKWDR